MEIRVGQIVKSLAGHDKGDFQIVMETDGVYALLCDGKRRSREKPKRKKLKHVAPTKTVIPENLLKTNRQIRSVLRPFQMKTQNDEMNVC